MEQVRSVDGTEIAFTRQGGGEPVLLVHGGPSTGESWAQVAPRLQSRHTVVTMDRRGRGASSDGAEYSLELEAADIATVIDALDGEVHVVGHSSGAEVALRAATRSTGLRSLTLYEPPLAIRRLPGSFFDRVDELLRAGDADAATELFFSTVAATPEEIELLKNHPPVWERFVASIPLAPRELRALATTTLDLDAVSRIDVPVLLLVGELTTSPHFLEGLHQLEGSLVDVRRQIIPGQRHLANAFAPEAFAELVESFLDSVDQGGKSLETTVR